MPRKVKIYQCGCGADITTMKGCRRQNGRYTYRKCGYDITRFKVEQLAERIKEEEAYAPKIKSRRSY